MEKFRRWTDQATGVNPFISSKRSSSFTHLPSLIFISLRIIIIIILHPLIILTLFMMLLQQKVESLPLGSFVCLSWKFLNLVLFGMWGFDDESFMRTLQKQSARKKDTGMFMLSNNCSMLDTFYYLSKIKNPKFLVSSPKEEQFYTITGLSMILRVLSKRQPFFEEKLKGDKLKSIVQRETIKSHNCILFYEGIRTNGMGTIKISNKLSNTIYQNEIDFCMVHLRYTCKDSIHSVVYHPLRICLEGFGHWQILVKARARIQRIESLNSGSELQKQIDIFLTANAAKLLDTHPSDYFQFLEYYTKSLKEGYTQK